ncbi:hypothetical protein [Glaciecola sp. SC05]|uniref:hypothetical protein n=1 Tax=Glaciecola sp. SC05 TaxID=1987355 RepID=UPI003527913E
MRNLALILFMTLLLSGCLSTYVPPMPPLKTVPNPKLGLYVNVSNTPKHTHVGTTIFNNDVKMYDYDWQMQSRIVELVSNKIESTTQYEVVDLSFLSPDEISKLDFATVNDKQWKLIEQNEDLRQKLLERGITAIMSIEETPTLAQLACSQYGCTEFYSQGHGLFTRSFFGLDTYIASASYIMTAELLDPGVDLFMFETLSEFRGFQKRHIILDDFEDPNDFENITEEEFLPVRAAIDDYLIELTTTISQFLNGELPKP